jgi:hypothetical protein
MCKQFLEGRTLVPGQSLLSALFGCAGGLGKGGGEGWSCARAMAKDLAGWAVCLKAPLAVCHCCCHMVCHHWQRPCRCLYCVYTTLALAGFRGYHIAKRFT